MLTRLDLRAATTGRPLPASSRALAALLPRPRVDGDEPVAAVRRILAEVRAGGDAAVRDLTEELDGVRLAELTVPQDELQAALDRIPDGLREALSVAAARIEAYHRTQREQPAALEQDGITIRSMAVPSEWSESAPEFRRHAPRLGQHTREVLKEAGYAADRIERLISSGAARVPPDGDVS